jgi:RND family efflux transporter MFP subunit
MQSAQRRLAFFILATFIALIILPGCSSQKNEYVDPPTPKVTVAKPLQKDMTDYLEFTGTTKGFEEVEVRARVSGFLESMHFTPGTIVQKGELLFVIDPKEYMANLSAAQAELQSANAQLKRAQIEYERALRLFKKKAGAETEVVKWRGERDVARASVARAKAQEERALLDMSYTQVISPITGRVSRNLVDIGNLVGEGEPTLLTDVTSFDPMYAYFNLNERDLLRVMKLYREKIEETGHNPDTEPARNVDIPLFLGLANEQGYPHEGKFDFAESGVDPGTGTLQLRGIFPNPGSNPVLLPGLFARIRMPIAKLPGSLMVTERAIGSDQSGRYLMVVNRENVVEKRQIRIGQLDDGLRVIEEGLRPDDRVIVKGIQRARSGAKVDPQPVEMSSLTASAIKAALQDENEATQPEAEKPPPPDAESNQAASYKINNPDASPDDTQAENTQSADKP